MSDIKLFRVDDNGVTELVGHSVAIEKSLQHLIEANLYDFLGVHFLASEYVTGKTHGGRIDTLGIDENHCPIIIEYKRTLNETVINQGLFYLDWLLDHKSDFILLVQKVLGMQKAEAIEWSNPRLLCIAGDFTRYDTHAVQQINRNIELIRYRRYGDSLLLFELVNATTAEVVGDDTPPGTKTNKTTPKTATELLDQANFELEDRFEALKAYLLALGDDVQMQTLKTYFAFKRLRNFACVNIHPASGNLIILVKVDPDTVHLEMGFTRDIRDIGHFGTGDLEITVASPEDLERAKPLLLQSYEAS